MKLSFEEGQRQFVFELSYVLSLYSISIPLHTYVFIDLKHKNVIICIMCLYASWHCEFSTSYIHVIQSCFDQNIMHRKK